MTGGIGLTAAENRVDSLQYTTAGHSACVRSRTLPWILVQHASVDLLEAVRR